MKFVKKIIGSIFLVSGLFVGVGLSCADTAPKVSVQVIVPEHCRICNVEPVLNQLKALFPAIETESLSAHTPQAKKIIAELNIQMLPAYLLSKDVEKEPAFHQLSQSVDLVFGRYYLKPQLTGVSYFLGREAKPGQLDLFLMLINKNAAHLLEISREIMEQSKEKIKVNLHLVSKRIRSRESILARAVNGKSMKRFCMSA